MKFKVTLVKHAGLRANALQKTVKVVLVEADAPDAAEILSLLAAVDEGTVEPEVVDFVPRPAKAPKSARPAPTEEEIRQIYLEAMARS